MWLAALLVAVLSGFGSAIYQLERAAQGNRVDGDLAVRIAALNTALRNAPFSRGGAAGPGASRDGRSSGSTVRRPPPGPPPDGPRPDRPPPPGPRPSGPPPGGFRPSRAPTARPVDLPVPAATASLFGEGPGAFYYVTWYRDNTLLSRSASAPVNVPPPPGLQHDTLTHWRMRDGWREAFHCSGLGDCVLAGRSTAGDVAALRTLALALFGIGAGVLTVALGVGWWLIGRAILPIEQIGAAASRISQGNLSERIPVPDNGTELGRLAAVLNSTFARLEAAFERQRQFTADAAHELRTPLAIMISETQTALARPRCADEYRETVEGCLDTSQQMRRLTESLLTLSRFDGGNVPAPRTQVDLRQAAREVIERVSPLARAKGIRIRADLSAASVLSSPDRMSQVITNLLTNAIEYNRAEGEVVVSTVTDSGSALLMVADTGVGIAEADLPFVFDRFFRVDRSRSRAEGHTGLGLSICKAIVEAEGGAIEAESKLNVGTTFTIRFPLKAT